MRELHITAIIPVWGRADILNVTIPKIPAWVNSAVFVVSPEDPHRLEAEAAMFGFPGDFVVVSYPNKPLGAKMNEGYYMATQFFHFDYVINIGSDDIIHPDLLSFYHHNFGGELPEGLIGIDSVDYFDTQTKKAMRCQLKESPIVMGAGRMISRQWIEDREGCINNPFQTRSLDTDSQLKLTSRGCPIHKLRADGFVLDIKSEGNINTFEAVSKMDVLTVKQFDPEYLTYRYGFDHNSL